MLFQSRSSYQFNPETLQYERRRVPFRQRLAKVSVEFLLCSIAGVGLFFIFVAVVRTPRVGLLEQERQVLLGEASVLEAKIQGATKRVALMEERDNQLYRTIFEADSIPLEVRLGGVGGAERYPHLRAMQDGESVRQLAMSLDQLRWRVFMQSKSFDQVAAMAHEKDRMMHSVPAVQPVSVKELTRVSSLFGYRRDPFTKTMKLHTGVDFVGKRGTPIHSTGDGLVIISSRSGAGYGNQVVVDHGFGYKTRYAHLQKLLVVEGERVKRGQIIGTMGSTGRSTSTHLHYEVLVKNRPVNPLLYFNDMSEEEYESMLANAKIEYLD